MDEIGLADGVVSGTLNAHGRDYKRTIWAIAVGIAIFAAAQGTDDLNVASAQFLKDALVWI